MMDRTFECPACGGPINYPEVDRIIDEYDLSGEDKYYCENMFGDRLSVICEWCKKRVEVPLDLPEENQSSSTEEPADIRDGKSRKNKQSRMWPNTRIGRVILGALILIMLTPFLAFAIFVLMGDY